MLYYCDCSCFSAVIYESQPDAPCTEKQFTVMGERERERERIKNYLAENKHQLVPLTA
jgi:hypothetical protein